MTNIDESASDIYVYNELFNLGRCNFENVTLQEFINLALNNGNTIYRGAGTVVPVKFTTESATTVKISTTGLTLKEDATGITTVEENVYTYTTSAATTVNLNDHFVLAANGTREISVTLTADNYQSASISAETEKRQYKSVSLSGADYYGENREVTLTYNMDYEMDITPTFEGLVINSTRAEMNLITTSFNGTRKVVLPENDVYEEYVEEKTAYILIIPVGKIKGNNSDKTLSVYTENPSYKWYPNNKLNVDMQFSEGANINYEVQKQGLASETELYFRYTTGTISKKYYVSGPHKISDILSSEGINLDFEEQ